VKLLKAIAKTAFLLSLAAPAAYSQNNPQKSLALDAAIAAKPDEHHLFMAEGLYVDRKLNFYGFIDGYGRRTDNYYGEFYSRHNLKGSLGLQLELNDGRDVPASFRAGGIFDVPRLPKNYTLMQKFSR
jgi:hypothetical protein